MAQDLPNANYALAESLARDAGDSSLLALVSVVRTGLYFWRRTGETHRALALLADAEAIAGPAAPPLLRTVILSSRAEDRAAIGDEIGCLRDLEAAEAALRPSATHFFGPRTPVELGAIRGTCESLLGRRREAVETFDWVLRDMDPALAAWRATVARDRDAALAASCAVDLKIRFRLSSTMGAWTRMSRSSGGGSRAFGTTRWLASPTR